VFPDYHANAPRPLSIHPLRGGFIPLNQQHVLNFRADLPQDKEKNRNELKEFV
jgi:hypothetical protein